MENMDGGESGSCLGADLERFREKSIPLTAAQISFLSHFILSEPQIADQ